MNNDDLNIKNLYESCTYRFFSKNLDFLNLECIENFDWDIFDERYSYGKVHLNEKFDYIGEKDLPQNTKQFSYLLTTPNNSEYHVKLNIYPNSSRLMDTSVLVSRSINSDKNVLYKKLLDKIKKDTGKYQLYISFYDSENNYNLTNNNKPSNESFVVFRSLENSLNHFLYILGYLKDISVIKFYVDRNETRRLQLYKRIIKRFTDIGFENYLEDDLSDSKYNMLTLF